MARLYLLLVALSGALVVSGCDGGSGIESGRPTLNVYHLAPDSPPVDVFLGNDVLVPDADYGDRARVTGRSGSRTLEARVNLPEGGSEALGQSLTEEFLRGSEWDIFATGAHGDVELLARERESVELDEGEFQLELGHLAPAVNEVTITLDSTDTGESFSLDFRDFSDAVALPGGDYDLQIEAGTDTLYELSGVSLEAGVTTQLFVIDNPISDKDDFPVTVMAVTNGTTVLVPSEGQGANVRVIHTGPDVDGGSYAVEVSFSSSQGDAETLPLTPGEIGELTLGVDSVLEPVFYDIEVAEQDGNAEETIEGLDLRAGRDYTLLIGARSSQNPQLQLLADNRRAVAGWARIRLLRGFDDASESRQVSLTLVGEDEFVENLQSLFTLDSEGSVSPYAIVREEEYAFELRVENTIVNNIVDDQVLEVGRVYSFLTRWVRGTELDRDAVILDD